MRDIVSSFPSAPISSFQEDGKLNDAEIERYSRHLILPEIGGVGQQKLKKSRVLVVGAGGLGCPLLSYLVAAGVGHIGIVDDDIVARSNLQRQILFHEHDIGQNKAESAAAHLRAQNSHITITAYPERLKADNIAALMHSHDIIADGTDNFTTRYLVADHATMQKKPLISAAINRFDGYLSNFKPYLQRPFPEDKQYYPHYRDIFPEQSNDMNLENCVQNGVLGVLAGLIGCLQALEVIREITGFDTEHSLLGKLLLVDALTLRFEKISL